VSLTLSLVLLAALSAGSAGATSLSTLKAQARAAQQRITVLNVAAEKKIEAYDRAHGQFLATKRRLQAAKFNLATARANLKASQIQLAHSLADSYKSGGQDPLMYVLAARSFGDLVDQMQLLQRRSSSDSSLVSEITKYRGEVTRQAKQLTVQKNLKARESRQARAAKDAALHSLNAAKRYEAGLSAKIQHLIAQAQAAAAARAAAAAAGASSGSTGTYTGPAPPASTLGGKAVAIAEQYLGVPYVWGGASPSGFDCSGLVMYVYGQLGVSLPHNAAAQYYSLPHVPLSDLQPGDLVFFYGLGHVGIYVGNGTMIHAPHTGTVVQFGSISAEGPIAGAARVPG
jgi:cell wall-associated NlpC family hydrolase